MSIPPDILAVKLSPQSIYLVVINGVVHGHISLQGDRHRHEDGPGHGHHVDGIEKVGEEEDVEVRDEAKALAKTLLKK